MRCIGPTLNKDNINFMIPRGPENHNPIPCHDENVTVIFLVFQKYLFIIEKYKLKKKKLEIPNLATVHLQQFFISLA